MQQLIEEIQADILNDSIPITSILRKAKVLAHHLRNDRFKQWVKSELDGYETIMSVPDYRIATTIPIGDIANGFNMYKNMQIPLSKFPSDLQDHVAFFRCTDGIKTVNDLSQQPEGVTLGYPSDLVLFLNRNLEEEDPRGGYQCLGLRRFVSSSFFSQIIDTVRSRLQDFILEISDLPWSGKSISVSPKEIDRLVQVNIFNNAQGGSVSTFDQRGQNVQYQYNVAGDINIDTVGNKIELSQELEKLKAEIERAAQANVIDADTAVDASYEITKVITEAQKPTPDKSSMLSRIEKAKSLVGNVSNLGGLALALMKAGEMIGKIFP